MKEIVEIGREALRIKETLSAERILIFHWPLKRLSNGGFDSGNLSPTKSFIL
jgi:hypothetical protein